MNPLESSFLIHKAMRFDSKGGRILDVISDNYEKLAPSADTRLRVNRSGIQQKIIMKFLHISRKTRSPLQNKTVLQRAPFHTKMKKCYKVVGKYLKEG